MFSSSKNICQLCGQGRVILYFIGSALTRYVKRKSLRKKYQSGSTMFPSEITCLVFVLNRKSHFSSEQPEKYQNIKINIKLCQQMQVFRNDLLLYFLGSTRLAFFFNSAVLTWHFSEAGVQSGSGI